MPRSTARLCPTCRQIVTGKCPTCTSGWTQRPTTRQLPTGHRTWRRIRAQVLAEQPWCATCGSELAAEVDHIIPITAGGSETDRDNLQGLCRACHKVKTYQESRGTNRDMTGIVTLICGPPCSGKSRYIREHSQPGDLLIDFDSIMAALSGDEHHQHHEHLRPLAFDARDAILKRLWSGRHEIERAWYIVSAPTEKDRRYYRLHGCRIVMMMADRDTLRARAQAERPTAWLNYIDQWLDTYDTNDIDQLVRTDGA